MNRLRELPESSWCTSRRVVPSLVEMESAEFLQLIPAELNPKTPEDASLNGCSLSGGESCLQMRALEVSSLSEFWSWVVNRFSWETPLQDSPK